MADPELIKEVMVELGENLEALGFDGPLEVIEGRGNIGKAVQNCRYDEDRKIVFLYLKDLAKTLVKEQPSPEIMKARQLVNAAWLEFKAACSDYLAPPDKKPPQKSLAPATAKKPVPVNANKLRMPPRKVK